jgi:hypothetical protein
VALDSFLCGMGKSTGNAFAWQKSIYMRRSATKK